MKKKVILVKENFQCVYFNVIKISLHLESSENLGSDEEEGKSWSDLEKEAKKGRSIHFY